MNAAVKAIAYYLPPCAVSLQEDSSGTRSAADLRRRTGVDQLRIAAEHECASDLGVAAAQQLLAQEDLKPENIDFLLFCTQTPDYSIPASACLIHAKLGLHSKAGALDYNLGCSGYVYGLSLAKGLIETSQADRVLLITADTHSKLVGSMQGAHVYGDGAAATLIEASQDPRLDPGIGPFIFGTDGTGARHIVSGNKAFRVAGGLFTGSCRTTEAALHVDGLGLFESSMRVVPALVTQVLEKAGLSLDDIRTAIFYQAGKSTLEMLRRHSEIASSKFYVSMSDCGNVSSSNIPISLRRAADEGVFQTHDRVLLIGFGSGLSWAGTVLRWAGTTKPKVSLGKKSLEEQESYAGT
jgi:3-oxoacyl-[acyl-carrier-protein] synthase III